MRMGAVVARVWLALAGEAGDGERLAVGALGDPRGPSDLAHVGVGHRGDENARLATVGHHVVRHRIDGIHAAAPRNVAQRAPGILRHLWGDGHAHYAPRWDAPEVGEPAPRDLAADASAHVTHAQPLEHGGGAALPHPARPSVPPWSGCGVLRVGPPL